MGEDFLVMQKVALAREAAAQGMVLLENKNHLLPLSKEESAIAVFGVGAVRTVRGGTGSGDPFNGGLLGGGNEHINQSPRYHIHILDSMKRAGFDIVTSTWLQEMGTSFASGRISLISAMEKLERPMVRVFPFLTSAFMAFQVGMNEPC